MREIYLHLGNDVVVNTKEIVGIYDIDNTSISKATKEYLAAAEKGGNVINVTYEIPKSYVVCENKGKTRVYISQLSPQTLGKRANSKRII
ncbi:MAG: DUF370 domain-containing protein [Oscillospiraceae bacterium]